VQAMHALSYILGRSEILVTRWQASSFVQSGPAVSASTRVTRSPR
jgi:hypothetical protein